MSIQKSEGKILHKKHSIIRYPYALIALPILLLSLALFSLPALASTCSFKTQFTDTGTAPELGETFSIDVSMVDVNYLYGIDFKLRYNTQCLDLIEAVPIPPWSSHLIIKNEINNEEGVYRLAMVGLTPAPPFDGSATLAKLTFVRIGFGEPNLLLADIILAEPSGRAIPYTSDGCVIKGILVHDVAIVEIRGRPRGVVQGGIISVDVVAENQGNFVETFDVTLYADQDKTIIGDELRIGTQTVHDLPAKEKRTLTFIWDTTGANYGIYWLSAEASQVPEETDVGDNFLRVGEYIGGIYPPPYVRRTADLLTQITSILVTATIAFAGTFHIKRYWFP